MEFKKIDLLIEDKSEEGIVKKTLSKLKDVKDRAQSEIKETRALVRVLTHAIKSYAKNREFDLNSEDKEFIKGQSVDVIRSIVLTVVAMIPLPIPLTPFLIIFGKKIGIDLVPKEHEIPDKGKKNKQKLDENTQKILNDENLNLVEKLCLQAKKRKLKSIVFCRLLEEYNISNDILKEKILTSLQKIFNFFIEDGIKDGKGINKGVFPKLVRISLDSNDFTHYLYIISEFLTDPKYSDDEIKTILKRYKGRDYAPLNLDDIATKIASKEYTAYEEKLTKDEFGISRTFLSLDYRCEEDIDKKLIELLKDIKKLPEEQKYQQFESFIEKFIGCLKQQLDNPKYTIKADAINNLEEPIKYDGEVMLKKGDYLEIKKMDFEVDSYLSEFFSIFKESKIRYLKKTHVIIYNYFVDRIFQWINENGQSYLDTVKNNLAGIIFDNNMFVPIEQINFYWSNKGQRGCNEKRLSIRFRINPGLQSLVAYVYEPGKGENSLTQKIIRELPSDIREKKICKDHLPPDFVIGESKKKLNMNIIITENQLNRLKILFESDNPCPKGTEVSKIITLDDVKNGSILNKGYCNNSSNSAIVKIQKMLKEKGLLDKTSPEGYYGNKTQQAVKDLFKPTNVTGEKIGPKTVAELESKKETKSSGDKVKKEEALKLFNNLSDNKKVLVCTLIGEAGGESNPKESMQAVANVLKNRADNDHLGKGKTTVAQALANKQFSMWNSYNDGKIKKQDVYDKYKEHSQMQVAIDIANSIDSIEDITKGANYYYADYVSPNWAKSTDTTNWVKTAVIGNHIFGNVVPKPKKKKG